MIMSLKYYLSKEGVKSELLTVEQIISELNNKSYCLNDFILEHNSNEWIPISKLFAFDGSTYIYLPSVTKNIHKIPKCTVCGSITNWKIEPVLLWYHWLIGLILICAYGSGLIYFTIILIIRSKEKNRAKICPKCGARNLWTFEY